MMSEVVFERAKGKVGTTTYAKVEGLVVGMWEGPNLLLAVRTGIMFRPLRHGGLEVVRMGNWTKGEWKRLVRDFASDDQCARKTFWEGVQNDQVAEGPGVADSGSGVP